MDSRLEVYTLTEKFSVDDNEVCEYLYNQGLLYNLSTFTSLEPVYPAQRYLNYILEITSEDALALMLKFPELEICKK